MDRITVYEELRLIERSESEVSTAWKGAHLLLFFLAFVFGSFCTFCFNMLMYLFDEKCVLFPKLLSLNSLRHNVIYEFLPQESKKSDPLPVDFLSTQFVHKSACYLPTYVPLVSGIFGLVWTTMFLMCSSGSRSLSGLHRPWRVIPPVLVFSVAMSCLCIYASIITHYGLLDLCLKLGEITGSTSCTYTVNVATLVYERQIRGVYQATRLTITSAWMHTACWVASTILAIVRILLAVDFRLVKIRAELVGNMDSIMEQNEEYLHTVMPTRFNDDDSASGSQVFSYFKNENYSNVREFGQLINVGSDILFISEQTAAQSDQALLSEERIKSPRILAYEAANEEHRFIVSMVYDMLDAIEHQFSSSSTTLSGSTSNIPRQFGQQLITSKIRDKPFSISTSEHLEPSEADEVMKGIRMILLKKVETRLTHPYVDSSDDATPSTSKKRGRISFESLHGSKKKLSVKRKTSKVDSSEHKKSVHRSSLKSTLKDASVQTERNKSKQHKVTIAETIDIPKEDQDYSSDSKKDEATQTKPKEKQD